MGRAKLIKLSARGKPSAKVSVLLRSLLYEIPLFLVGQAHEQDGQDAGAEKHRESHAPARLLGHQADDRVRQEEGSEEITEEAGQAGGRSGRILRSEVQGLHADEHHRSVDEESDADEGDDDHGQVVDESPVQDDEDRHEGHEDHRRKGAHPMEELVRQPAAEERPGDGRELIGEIGPAGALEVDALFREDGGRPVQAAVADHIDECVREGDVPEELVVQDMLEEDFLGGDGLLVLFGVVLGVVVPPFFHGRKPAGLRRVPEEDVGQQGDKDGDRGREGGCRRTSCRTRRLHRWPSDPRGRRPRCGRSSRCSSSCPVHSRRTSASSRARKGASPCR